MTYAPTTATGNGAQVDFSFTFPYLSQLDVKVTVNDVPTTAFTFFSASIIRFAVAPVNGADIVIFRETPTDDLSTVIQPGSALPVDGLNNNFLQSLYAGQEVAYLSANQSTAGLQAQITTANNNASNAVVTANAAEATAIAAEATANGLADSIATANSNASTALSAANAALPKAGGTMTGAIVHITDQPGLGRKNLLINPNFVINQRVYVSGAATSGANAYTVDRWRVVISGQNLSWTTSNGVLTATAPAGGVEQIIEGASLIPGTYVINWTGTATCTVGGIARAKGASFTITGGADVTVRFTGGTVSLPQLERGTIPTMFEGRHIGEELLLCQRYFWNQIGGLSGNFASYVSGALGSWWIKFPSTMRVAPTLGYISTGVTLNSINTLVWSGPTTHGAKLSADSNAVTPNANFTFGAATIIAADAEL